MSQIAKLFKNGRSQAVRLPAAFRFAAEEIYIRKDPESGNVILSRKPSSWDDFFVALNALPMPTGFLSPEERDPRTQDRDVFEGHVE